MWAFGKHQSPFLKYFVLSQATGHPFTLPSTLLLLDFLYILTTGAGSRKHGLGNAFWQEGFLLGVIRVLLTGQTLGRAGEGTWQAGLIGSTSVGVGVGNGCGEGSVTPQCLVTQNPKVQWAAPSRLSPPLSNVVFCFCF